MSIHKKTASSFYYLPPAYSLLSFSSNVLLRYCTSTIIASVLLSSPLHAQLRDPIFPDYADLSQVQGAVVARICLNQVLAIPTEQQSRMSSSTRSELLKCMINYREVFSKEQLEIIRLLISNPHHKSQ